MTEPKSTDRSALVGRLRMIASRLERGYETATITEAAALIEPPPAGEIQGLVEALRAKAKSVSEVSWMLANAKTTRNRAAEGDPNDSNGYQGQNPEQTIEWKAAEALTRLSVCQPSDHGVDVNKVIALTREACAKIAEDFAWVLPLNKTRAANEASDNAAETVKRNIAEAILAMSLPLSSGSNKSDDGKKGQAE